MISLKNCHDLASSRNRFADATDSTIPSFSLALPHRPVKADCMRGISGRTAVFGIAGNPVSHSISPVLHNRAFEKTGYDGVYVPFHVDETGPFLKKAILHMGISGLSVTIPYKIWAAKIADERDALTGLTGAANTLIVRETRNGKILSAHNTDGPGAMRALRTAVFDLKGQVVVIAGYGGSARAIAGQLLLASDVKRIVITGRNMTKIRAFIRSLTRTHPDWKSRLVAANEEELMDQEAHILINTTPLGMKGFDLSLPVPESFLRSGLTVMDIVYRPEITPLLALAKKRRARIIPGYWMLLFQAVLQFELFTGMKAGPEIENFMRLNLLTFLRSHDSH
jgi:shikimate dehydrogenase